MKGSLMKFNYVSTFSGEDQIEMFTATYKQDCLSQN